jgi:hypothetical protein
MQMPQLAGAMARFVSGFFAPMVRSCRLICLAAGGAALIGLASPAGAQVVPIEPIVRVPLGLSHFHKPLRARSRARAERRAAQPDEGGQTRPIVCASASGLCAWRRIPGSDRRYHRPGNDGLGKDTPRNADPGGDGPTFTPAR